MFRPRFHITSKTAKALMAIEADLASIAALPLSAQIVDELRRTARLLSTHFSTQMAGNRLTMEQVKTAIDREENLRGQKCDNAKAQIRSKMMNRQTAFDANSLLRTLSPQQRQALG